MPTVHSHGVHILACEEPLIQFVSENKCNKIVLKNAEILNVAKCETARKQVSTPCFHEQSCLSEP